MKEPNWEAFPDQQKVVSCLLSIRLQVAKYTIEASKGLPCIDATKHA